MEFGNHWLHGIEESEVLRKRKIDIRPDIQLKFIPSDFLHEGKILKPNHDAYNMLPHMSVFFDAYFKKIEKNNTHEKFGLLSSIRLFSKPGELMPEIDGLPNSTIYAFYPEFNEKDQYMVGFSVGIGSLDPRDRSGHSISVFVTMFERNVIDIFIVDNMAYVFLHEFFVVQVYQMVEDAFKRNEMKHRVNYPVLIAPFNNVNYSTSGGNNGVIGHCMLISTFIVELVYANIEYYNSRVKKWTKEAFHDMISVVYDIIVEDWYHVMTSYFYTQMRLLFMNFSSDKPLMKESVKIITGLRNDENLTPVELFERLLRENHGFMNLIGVRLSKVSKSQLLKTKQKYNKVEYYTPLTSLKDDNLTLVSLTDHKKKLFVNKDGFVIKNKKIKFSDTVIIFFDFVQCFKNDFNLKQFQNKYSFK
jgi:hypothetical protein